MLGSINRGLPHNMKRGGAGNAGFKLADPELKDRHAGWKNPNTELRYQEQSTED